MGAEDKLKGKLKEAGGALTDDEELKREGRADQKEGEAEEKAAEALEEREKAKRDQGAS